MIAKATSGFLYGFVIFVTFVTSVRFVFVF